MALRRPRCLHLPPPAEHACDSDWSKRYWHRPSPPKPRCAEVKRRNVLQYALAYQDFLQVRLILQHRLLAESAAIGIIEQKARQTPPRHLAKIAYGGDARYRIHATARPQSMIILAN
jgi:hypothetical protein